MGAARVFLERDTDVSLRLFNDSSRPTPLFRGSSCGLIGEPRSPGGCRPARFARVTPRWSNTGENLESFDTFGEFLGSSSSNHSFPRFVVDGCSLLPIPVNSKRNEILARYIPTNETSNSRSKRISKETPRILDTDVVGSRTAVASD